MRLPCMPVGLDYRKGYFYQEGIKEGRKVGRNQGKIEGQQNTYSEVALNMYSMGFSIDDISKITKMSIKDLQELFKKHKK